MEKQYKLGIIGFGGMGSHHAGKLANGRTKVVVKGVYDIRPERMEAAREKGFVCYESEEALLADKDIDIVLVATPNDLHHDMCIRALKAGKHVLCEKPVMLSSDELVDVMAFAKKCGKVFTIDQNRRVNRDFIMWNRAVDSGMIGKLYLVESHVDGSKGIPGQWRSEKVHGGGMMLDWGVHMIDQMMHYDKSKVVNVFCKIYMIHNNEVDDNFELTMTFEDGLVAVIGVGTNNFISHPRWYVCGENGTIQIDGFSTNGKLIRKICDDDSWNEEIANTKMGPSRTMSPRHPDSYETIELQIPEDITDTVEPTYWQLTDAIEGKAPLTITPEQALRVMKVMEASFESSLKGEAIKTDI